MSDCTITNSICITVMVLFNVTIYVHTIPILNRKKTLSRTAILKFDLINIHNDPKNDY